MKVRYLDMAPDQLRQEYRYWLWQLDLAGLAGPRLSSRNHRRILRMVRAIEAAARKRRIRLDPSSGPHQGR